jgi:hypothetical protein
MSNDERRGRNQSPIIRGSKFVIRYSTFGSGYAGVGGERKVRMEEHDREEIPLLTKEEAIAEVRRWLGVEKVDPERIFAAFGETMIRYKDLIPHLEQETPDGRLLLFAISRGRAMKKSRDREMEALLEIIAPPPDPETPATS